jgi:GNAT superfamily N-acetyltransferase
MAYQLVYPALAKALHLALKADGFYQKMEASVDGDGHAKREAMLVYMDYSIVEGREFGECYIPSKQHYGVSVWSKPLSSEIQAERSCRKRSVIETHMGQASYQAYDAMCTFMAEQSAPLVASDAWYLSIVGILPEFQGQGLGPGLIESVLSQSDKLGVATYLETFTPRNMTFYQRLGYTTLASFTEPTCGSEYWLMQRTAP